MSERIINAERIEQIINVFGSFDENIKRIEQTYGVKITNRGTELKISGEDEAADRAGRAIEGLLLLAAKGETIDEQKVRYLIDLVSSGNEDKIGEMAKDVVCITAKGRPVKAKTLGQQRYMKAISKNTITIGRRSGRYRQDIPRRGGGRGGLPREGGQPHHPDAPRRRGGRTARVPARRPAEQGRPVSAPAV